MHTDTPLLPLDLCPHPSPPPPHSKQTRRKDKAQHPIELLPSLLTSRLQGPLPGLPFMTWKPFLGDQVSYNSHSPMGK